MRDRKRAVGIDASRARSGGARRHLVGLIAGGDPRDHGIDEVHLWVEPSFANKVPKAEWLITHPTGGGRLGLVGELLWQKHELPKELSSRNCQVVLNVDAGTVNPFQPAVTMSRDLLSFEPGAAVRFGLGLARARLLALRYVQCRSLANADVAVFLTEYAKRLVLGTCKRATRAVIIPHGVGEAFRSIPRLHPNGPRIRCVYVSNDAPYKHHRELLLAVRELRSVGWNFDLLLVGRMDGRIGRQIRRVISADPLLSGTVELHGEADQNELPGLIAERELFLFASSCENMPNTLLEGMAAGRVIASSNRGPMPEVLADGGVYFDPESPKEIAEAMTYLFQSRADRLRLAHRANELAKAYSWERCARETWELLSEWC